MIEINKMYVKNEKECVDNTTSLHEIFTRLSEIICNFFWGTKDELQHAYYL